MPAPFIALLALAAAQPAPVARPGAAPDDGPVATAPRDRPAVTEAPGLDERTVEASAPAPDAAKPEEDVEAAPGPPPGSSPGATAQHGIKPEDGPDQAARATLDVEARTKADGETLQVVLGQRALFRLDDRGWPVLIGVEDGRLAAAHPPGKVVEAFDAPPDGQVAVALDGSAEVRATLMKIWNQTDKALDYRAIALVYSGGKVIAAEAPVCAVAARSVRTETWRRPVVGVGLSRFKTSTTTRACP
ncbi:hypothetical protein [Phenylobacterium sp. SCN 70-31]|uniref:hypothetical protein n=1 Tax=Phenylobacterium sp. SCN 70-31 TaxID=1660129 RepID=UPI0008683CC4|nr:hypothetical protein [Phenylobacterium sp. SCN 70-31]ODT88657.1 MAG: hypothetical protein ABS78_05720 [Phenylobacterium sp. SCN 70-31]